MKGKVQIHITVITAKTTHIMVSLPNLLWSLKYVHFHAYFNMHAAD